MTRGFGVNAEVSVKCRNCREFKLTGRAKGDSYESFFGVETRWNLHLERKNAYCFVVAFITESELPDFATVNDKIVWRNSDGVSEKNKIYLYYVAGDSSCEPVVRLFYRATKSPRTVDLKQSLYDCGHYCRIASFNGDKPVLAEFPLPDDATYVAEDAAHHALLFYDTYGGPAEYNRPPLAKLDRHTANLVVLQRCIEPAKGGRYLQMADAKTLTFQPHPYINETVFSRWANAAFEAGIRNLVMTPVLDIQKNYDPNWEKGGYCFGHIHSLMHKGKARSGKFYPIRDSKDKRDAIDSTADCEVALMKNWLRRSPSAQLYHFNVEMNGAFSSYRSGIRMTPVGEVDGYEQIRSLSPRRALETVFEFFRYYHRRLKDGLGKDASRLKIIANFDRVAFQGAYAAKSGADVIIHKSIHRQSINLAVANSRGTAKAYGVEYGYDFDQWDRNYWWGYPPEPIRHGLMVMYHAGPRYIMNEIDIFNSRTGKLTGWGPMWFDFLRYAKLHPPRGEAQARIAVMRGFGDEWDRVSGQSAGWDSGRWLPIDEVRRSLQSKNGANTKCSKIAMLPNRPEKLSDSKIRNWLKEFDDAIYMHDFSLLNLLFANFGTEHQTDMNRLCTGTPFGPVDFIPWDTLPGILNQYDVVLYFGRGEGTAPLEIKTLENYVLKGGTLVIAAGQLRDVDDSILVKQFCGTNLCGNRRNDAGLVYTKLEPVAKTAKIVERLGCGDAKLISAAFGKGQCLLFSGEWLTYWDDDSAIEACRGALSGSQWLFFEPASEWLEYQVRCKKENCWIFPIFNHGRGFYPSGNGPDHGVWKGKLVFDLNELGLAGQAIEAWCVQYDCDGKPDPFCLKSIEIVVSPDGRNATIELVLDEFEEIIIGPKGEAKAEFFR